MIARLSNGESMSCRQWVCGSSLAWSTQWPNHHSCKASQPTWITAEADWIEYFGLVVSAHHGHTVEPLGLLSFETGFRSACEAVGWQVDPPGPATQRFGDLTVRTTNGRSRKLSLKSTAARNLSKTSVHISKLTEAAWIQDVRSARDRKTETLKLFQRLLPGC